MRRASGRRRSTSPAGSRPDRNPAGSRGGVLDVATQELQNQLDSQDCLPGAGPAQHDQPPVLQPREVVPDRLQITWTAMRRPAAGRSAGRRVPQQSAYGALQGTQRPRQAGRAARSAGVA